MTSLTRSRFLSCLAAGAAALAAPAAFAQQGYPDRPIKLIVPFAPGGATDILGRLLAAGLSDKLGQPVVVENRPGAGTVVAGGLVAKAPPDGYTIGATASSTIIATPLLNAQVPFDADNDFAFVSLLATVPMVLTVNESIPVRNAAEFVKYLQANKGKLNFGSTAVGHYGHVSLMELSDALGAGLVHAPYKGETPLMQDLISGHLQFAFFAPSTAKPMAESGRLRMIGVSGTQRVKSLPDVPTLAEQGWDSPVFKMNPGWIGVVAPARTPAAIVQRLSEEYVAAVKRPEVNAQLADYGLGPVGSTAEQFAATYRTEKPMWRQLLVKAGLEVKG